MLWDKLWFKVVDLEEFEKRRDLIQQVFEKKETKKNENGNEEREEPFWETFDKIGGFQIPLAERMWQSKYLISNWREVITLKDLRNKRV